MSQSSAYTPHQARPQPPSIHSANPLTAGRPVSDVGQADESWFPLEALCSSCGQILTLPSRDGSWMHREVRRDV